ncbi:unnamed protein product [Acanthoscelides obtectus]|uniref:Uncharacterized protein n=1 Tax=Acanthoscelides obtectus TaxID=200917 RepID=A0A9P0PJQ3_ACAOB|nr:unnamed protein product [Acanthoscelides obtectus]CAK1624633.1 hypothetical protein AOBTE_LOCUS2664 [Acanthoscelides obtectus]
MSSSKKMKTYNFHSEWEDQYFFTEVKGFFSGYHHNFWDRGKQPLPSDVPTTGFPFFVLFNLGYISAAPSRNWEKTSAQISVV